MKIPVTFHLCTSCYAINNRKSDKHQWDVSGWLPESSVGVCLSIQTAFWNEIPWKIQVVFWLQKDGWPFFFFFPQYTNQLRQADGEIMKPTLTLRFSLVFWAPSSLAFASLYLTNLLWKIYLVAFSVLETAWTLSTTKSVSRWQILFPPLTLWYAIAAVSTSLPARSPDPIDSWLTFTLKANHAINTVMFYFH